MNTAATKRDLVEGNFEKVFPDGLEPTQPVKVGLHEITLRPGEITDTELNAAKALSMAGPLIPEFVRGNAGVMLGIMQTAKRFSRYDARTNSWITFDPMAIASCMYLVESSKGVSVGYTSAFIAAIMDGFGNLATRMRYTYEGEGETRCCIASARLQGDPEPFVLKTPELRLITPKKSPLWQSNPDQQLAYFARRNWGRLYIPGVLLGIYDVEELDGEARQFYGPNRAKDVSESVSALRRRLAAHAESQGEAEPAGYHPDAVNRGLSATPPETATEGQGEALPPEGHLAEADPKKRASGASAKEKPAVRTGRKPGAAQKPPSAKVVKAVADRAEAVPRNAKEYRRHVEGWLLEYDTEQNIEARWRSEMKLRNHCGLVEEERLPIRLLIDQRIAKLRK